MRACAWPSTLFTLWAPVCIELIALEVDFGALEMFGHALRKVQRAGTADVIGEIAFHFLLECGILARLGVGKLPAPESTASEFPAQSGRRTRRSGRARQVRHAGFQFAGKSCISHAAGDIQYAAMQRTPSPLCVNVAEADTRQDRGWIIHDSRFINAKALSLLPSPWNPLSAVIQKAAGASPGLRRSMTARSRPAFRPPRQFTSLRLETADEAKPAIEGTL